MTEITTVKAVAARLRRMARSPSNNPQEAAGQSAESSRSAEAKRLTKQDLVIELLSRESGALLTDLVETTGWLPHTARAALTGLKKKGHKIVGTKVGKPHPQGQGLLSLLQHAV